MRVGRGRDAGPRAHLDLGTVALARGQWEVVIHRAQQGALLGSGHPTMLATAGAPDVYWGPFYRALALAGLGYLEQAEQVAAAVVLEPTLVEDLPSVLGSDANLSESQKSVLVDRVALIRGSGEASY